MLKSLWDVVQVAFVLWSDCHQGVYKYPMLSCPHFCHSVRPCCTEFLHQQPRICWAAQWILTWGGFSCWNGTIAWHSGQWRYHCGWQASSVGIHDSDTSDPTYHGPGETVWHWPVLQLWDGAVACPGRGKGTYKAIRKLCNLGT